MRNPIACFALVSVASACYCGEPSGPIDPSDADVQLIVDVAASRRPISPLIYGINQDVDYAADRSTRVRPFR